MVPVLQPSKEKVPLDLQSQEVGVLWVSRECYCWAWSEGQYGYDLERHALGNTRMAGALILVRPALGEVAERRRSDPYEYVVRYFITAGRRMQRIP